MKEFSEIYLNTFYIGVTTEIKLLRLSKTLNHVHIYVPIRLHHVLRENNERLITSNGRINFFFSIKIQL